MIWKYLSPVAIAYMLPIWRDRRWTLPIGLNWFYISLFFTGIVSGPLRVKENCLTIRHIGVRLFCHGKFWNKRRRINGIRNTEMLELTQQIPVAIDILRRKICQDRSRQGLSWTNRRKKKRRTEVVFNICRILILGSVYVHPWCGRPTYSYLSSTQCNFYFQTNKLHVCKIRCVQKPSK